MLSKKVEMIPKVWYGIRIARLTYKNMESKMKRSDVFKCELCGNIVEMNVVGGGELVCCNQPMNAMEEKTADFNTEKHVPVVEKVEGGIKVIVGSTLHPMEDKHYIQWIEVLDGDIIFRKYLNPGEKPEALFNMDFSDTIVVREFCNLHGLWKS